MFGTIVKCFDYDSKKVIVGKYPAFNEKNDPVSGYIYIKNLTNEYTIEEIFAANGANFDTTNCKTFPNGGNYFISTGKISSTSLVSTTLPTTTTMAGQVFEKNFIDKTIQWIFN